MLEGALLVSQDEERKNDAIESFLKAMFGSFSKMDRLHEWSTGALRRNLGELGCGTGADVRLSDYLRAARARAAKDRDFDKLAAFGRLEDHMRERTWWREALENLRDLARGIFPPLLTDAGLGAALQTQARKAAVPVEISADGIGRYPQAVEAAVYFCRLEALQNVAKYARASAAVVRVREEGRELTFEVADDGVGFDPGAVGANSTGLQGIADRLSALGGSLEVRSAPGQGTTLIGRIPLGGGAQRAGTPST
jgi:signal transduction histidine kinase